MNLITALRLIMPTEGGVLGRTWVVEGFVGGALDDGSLKRLGKTLRLFENSWQSPLTIDGQTLVEGAAIAGPFEEGAITRRAWDDKTVVDLEIDLEAGDFKVITDDFEAFSVLENYIEMNSRR